MTKKPSAAPHVRARDGRQEDAKRCKSLPTTDKSAQQAIRGQALTWRRDGAGWVLLAGRRRFGRVVPDIKYPGMWRSTLSGGRLSDMANLAWAKNAVLVAAERELEWEDRT